MKNYTRKKTEFKGFQHLSTKAFKKSILDYKKTGIRAYYAGEQLFVIAKDEQHYRIPLKSYYLKNDHEELILDEKQFKNIFGK